MIRRSLIALALAATAAPALATDDARIVTRRYDPSAIVRVAGHVGIQATIAFDEDERIENVAIGDFASWQVTPNKRANLLFVKPVSARARTNMTVVTDQRTYLFDLVAAATAAPLYVLRFTYPPKPKLVVTAPVAVAEAPKPVVAPILNFGWKARGSKALIPARAFDDGQATYLAWSSDAAIPAILVRDAKGAEGPVNFTVQGDTVVVDGVPPLLVLRSGKEIATLELQPQPQPGPPARVAVAESGAK